MLDATAVENAGRRNCQGHSLILLRVSKTHTDKLCVCGQEHGVVSVMPVDTIEAALFWPWLG